MHISCTELDAHEDVRSMYCSVQSDYNEVCLCTVVEIQRARTYRFLAKLYS